MTGLSRRTVLQAAVGTAAGLSVTAELSVSNAAIAEGAFPSRPIHLVVGFPPGSAADITARAFGNGADDSLGQKVVVENKPGAGSNLAAEYVAHAGADGYTLFLATISNVTDQAVRPNPAFDLVGDFAPVSLLASGAIVLVVSPQSKLRSVAELIALAKAKPDGFLCATAGIGSVVDLVAVLFAQRAGIALVRVPYQGSPQAVSDLMAGRVTMFFSPASTVIGQIAAGKLTALATAATRRTSVLPEVPSMAEAGMPGFDASLWLGLMAPARTPHGAIATIAKAAAVAMRAPNAVATLKRLGFDPIGEGPERFGPYVRDEVARWSEVARRAGMKQ